jgi:hypothetical protein
MSKYFKTSDGEEFYTENHARNHAKSLKDKTVTPPDVAVSVEENEDETSKEVVINFSKMTKKQLVEFAVSKGIEVDEKATKAIIITTIENALAATAANDLDVDADDVDADADADADADDVNPNTQE